MPYNSLPKRQRYSKRKVQQAVGHLVTIGYVGLKPVTGILLPRNRYEEVPWYSYLVRTPTGRLSIWHFIHHIQVIKIGRKIL